MEVVCFFELFCFFFVLRFVFLFSQLYCYSLIWFWDHNLYPCGFSSVHGTGELLGGSFCRQCSDAVLLEAGGHCRVAA